MNTILVHVAFLNIKVRAGEHILVGHRSSEDNLEEERDFGLTGGLLGGWPRKWGTF